MGFWQTSNDNIIGDEFADIVDRHIDIAWKELLEAYPTVTREQFAETLVFCGNVVDGVQHGIELRAESREPAAV